MSLTELIPNLQKLERADKLRALQFLSFELAKEESVSLFIPHVSYPIWTPPNTFVAASTLTNILASIAIDSLPEYKSNRAFKIVYKYQYLRQM